MMYLSTGVGCLQNAVVSSIILPNLELQGTIPDSIGMLSYLQTIEMSSNQLYGSLPSTVGLLSELLILDLSSNSLDSIPNELANLVNLTTLILDGNSLEGTIPVFLAEMTQLEILSLRANKFTGNFPDVFCEMNHTEVFVHGNQFLCYSECLLHGAEDGCVYPPKPALLSAGAIAGIAVAFFFVCYPRVAFRTKAINATSLRRSIWRYRSIEGSSRANQSRLTMFVRLKILVASLTNAVEQCWKWRSKWIGWIWSVKMQCISCWRIRCT
jgi:hypothetical protein